MELCEAPEGKGCLPAYLRRLNLIVSATEKCLTKGSKNGIIRMLCKAQRFLTPVKRGHSPKGGQSNGSYQFL